MEFKVYCVHVNKTEYFSGKKYIKRPWIIYNNANPFYPKLRYST
jgi:hypothetical protein